jgi:restriction modification system DNA specificity domain protein
MTPQQLRNSILQMAIEGKLVEQRIEEGTGEELYQVIQEEKETLMRAGKLKKQKPLPEITEDEIPFEIPNTWKWCKLSELCMVLNGDRGKNYPAKSLLSSTGIPFVSAVNIKNKMVSNDENLLCMTNQQYDNLRSGKLEKGDIVFCIRGSLGKYGYYPFDKGAIASSLVILKACYNCKVFIEYLMIYLETPLLFSEIKKYDNGTAQPNLSAKNLEKFLFPLPPIEEQKRIVEKIGTIFPIIYRYENAWQKLNELNKKFPEELQKSILQEAIQGKLCKQRAEEGSGQVLIEKILLEKERLIESGQIKKQKALAPIQEDERLFDIPNSWEWCYLGELFSHVAGKALNAKNTKGRKYKYLTTSNVYWDYFDLRKLKEMYYTDDEIEKYSVKYGDLLVLEGGDVGRSAIWNLEDSYCIQNHIHRLRPYDNICVKYFYYVMMYFKYSGNILGKGIGIKGLSSNALHCIKVPVPSLLEQFRIVKKVDKIITIINRYKKIFNCIGN